MKKTFFPLFLLFIFCLNSSAKESQTKTVKHSFVCTDYTSGKVCIISEDGKLLWDYPAENCNDLWVLPNGNLLFNSGKGVKEVTRDKKVVFSYESKSEIFACQRLADGNTFVGECNSGMLLEVNPAGEIVKKIKLLADGADGGHLFMRNARKLDNGHYLVAQYGQDKVCEYDSGRSGERNPHHRRATFGYSTTKWQYPHCLLRSQRRPSHR